MGAKQSQSRPEVRTTATNNNKGPVPQREECPLCCDVKDNVVPLDHVGGGPSVASHRACSDCQAKLIESNQRCPWCRDEVMWHDIFGFLDGLKGEMRDAGTPDQLAELMAKWQIYEMTRGKADVVRFARDLVEDPSVAQLLDRAMRTNATWLLDSSGLWCRFHAMCVAGEVVPRGGKNGRAVARLAAAVECALRKFEASDTVDGAAAHGGAMYAQVVTALLCANGSGMSTTTLESICRRVGRCIVQKWSGNAQIAAHCPAVYVAGASRQIWGDPKLDPVLTTFFPAHVVDA
eukprot:m.177592 g.177592  ORF g.177592 m.177592 type:complete len:291 (+) comp14381_c0_seq1:207-1079(+)